MDTLLTVNVPILEIDLKSCCLFMMNKAVYICFRGLNNLIVYSTSTVPKYKIDLCLKNKTKYSKIEVPACEYPSF